jgi:hypothetical protein
VALVQPNLGRQLEREVEDRMRFGNPDAIDAFKSIQMQTAKLRAV